jgi:hypothetical protein
MKTPQWASSRAGLCGFCQTCLPGAANTRATHPLWARSRSGFCGRRMVGVAGFEPATPASRTQCSTRLSHTPTMRSGLIAKRTRPRKRRISLFAQCLLGRIITSAQEHGHADIARAKGLRYVHRLSRRAAPSAPPAGHPGGWCNGNTAVFGTVILGSSPSPPARFTMKYDYASSNTPKWPTYQSRESSTSPFSRCLR